VTSVAIEAIKRSLEKVKGLPGMAGQLSDTTDIVNDVRLDSLEMLRFMLELEASLSIQIDFDRLEYSYFNSIETLAEFISAMPPGSLSLNEP
jgi:acyl carrier protein